MRLSIWPNPERSFTDTLEIVRAAEAAGWHAAYVADHFMDNVAIGEPAPTPMLEATSTLVALAQATSSIKVGTLVASATYRHPAVLANWAATTHEVSQGRLLLGLGAGWQENEHHEYGIDLGSIRTRVDRFEEYVAIVDDLLAGEVVTTNGAHYHLHGAHLSPAPGRGAVPLLLGVKGERRTMAIAARHAQIWNAWCTPAELEHRNGVLDRHCAAIGRDPRTITRSTQAMVAVLDDPARAEQLRTALAGRPAVVGSAPQVLEQLLGYAEVGCDEFIVPCWILGGTNEVLATIETLTTEVLPHLG